MSNASLYFGSSEELKALEVMVPKSVVPVSDFQPLSLLRISSAREMCRSLVEAGESFPGFEA
jgi:hypothetical protein